MKIRFLLFALFVATTQSASAQSTARWTAASSTALAITGNVTFQDNTLTFGNGVKLALSPIGRRSGQWDMFAPASEGFLFELKPPSDPVLRNGNRLCGDSVRYLVISFPSPTEVSITAYAGAQEPKGGMNDLTCAVYNYQNQTPNIRIAGAAAPGASGPLAVSNSASQTLKSFRDCDRCPEMVVLPAGKFMMGASAADLALTDAHSYASELPRHEVTIGYSFAIGRFEVTVEQFAAYIAETGAKTGGECQVRTPDMGPNQNRYLGTLKPGARHLPGLVYLADADFRRPGAEVSGEHPATCISRREALGYLEWLSKKSGKKYRFPTEAEWEYAVRAGSTTPFHHGGGLDELCRYGNFADRNSPFHAKMFARCAQNPSPGMTVPAGRYQPNAWGLHDMSGNAFEFIEDCASPNYNNAPADGSPYGNPSSCTSFATRGYFFESPGNSLRSAARCSAATWDGRSNGLAIRAAVSMDDMAWDRRR